MKKLSRSFTLHAPVALLSILFVLAGCSNPGGSGGGPGLTWTGRTLPSSQNWHSVTHGNGVFVAVADGDVAATSP
jgi:hypothetical protein